MGERNVIAMCSTLMVNPVHLNPYHFRRTPILPSTPRFWLTQRSHIAYLFYTASVLPLAST
ncbi:hypothetical protein I7I48_00896 [Histoplasma ohiense]|uniref:Uncharacterized protein n=1 Tax=Ajellomyces capsulatus (strain H88) TaxID=544711 RepID=A0A8A1LQU8_AJEC8|nr:hypothetical protein I7I48_00896 [Histoplasma ohiense (nom. inval.)]QSS55505.1 hypothetical protein I7I53_03399 [Histoplasma capsulatum var. duboisii H88]